MTILAISGSLRARSSNKSLLEGLALIAPAANAQVTLYQGLATLPHFNPDLDQDPAPPNVTSFRKQLQSSNAVVICSPEYAHGVPGSLKNALDWIVSSAEFVDKPVALINASARASLAYESLAETLRTMMARILPAASLTIPVSGTPLSAEEIAAHPEFGASLRSVIAALTANVG